MRTIKNKYRNDIKMLKAGSTTIEGIQKNIEDQALRDEDEESDEENRGSNKRSFEKAFQDQYDNGIDNEINSIFVYGSLRPDDDSKTNLVKQYIDTMIHQKAVIKDTQLYFTGDGTLYNSPSASVVYDRPGSKVRGWLLTTHSRKEFAIKLAKIDSYLLYKPERPVQKNIYIRRLIKVNMIDKHGNVTSMQNQAYCYNRTELDFNKAELIPNGCWLRGNKNKPYPKNMHLFTNGKQRQIDQMNS